MIPSIEQCERVWDTYDFPEIKRIHVRAVWAVACVFIDHIRKTHPSLFIHKELIDAACLLHDIDKNVPKLPGERHPDASVRIMKQEGFDELVPVVRRHPLHMILDSEDAPQTVEEKIVYLSDKMAKYEPLGVAGRFALWNDEHLPSEAQKIVDTAYPLVCTLSDELCRMAGMSEDQIIREATEHIESR
jgi:hypothetical protein